MWLLCLSPSLGSMNEEKEMTTKREEALIAIRSKAGNLEDFLQGDRGDKTVNIVDPNCTQEEITKCVNACQVLIHWCADEIAEEREDEEVEVFEEEKITTLDDELRDRGLNRSMF